MLEPLRPALVAERDKGFAEFGLGVSLDQNEHPLDAADTLVNCMRTSTDQRLERDAPPAAFLGRVQEIRRRVWR